MLVKNVMLEFNTVLNILLYSYRSIMKLRLIQLRCKGLGRLYQILDGFRGCSLVYVLELVKNQSTACSYGVPGIIAGTV